MSATLASAPGEHCFTAVKHTGTPTGHTEIIAGAETYVALPPGSTGTGERFEKIILFFADVYGRSDLDLKTRELVIIAAGAALGATGIDVIKFHVPNALRAGANRAEIFGTLIQVAIVAGIPTALAAITAAAQVMPKASGADADGASA